MNFIKLIILSFVILFSYTTVQASTSVGTIDPSFKLTKICKNETCSQFSNVNWKPTLNASTTGALPVTITDTSITGHIWGDEIGWINLAPTGAGVFVNPSTGVLSGKAFSNTGSWINFAVTGQSVVINSQGEFFGWAWVSGAGGGWMKFDCSLGGFCVKTDWLPIPYRNETGSQSGGMIAYVPNNFSNVIQPQDTTVCNPYLLEYIKLGEKNNPIEVKKLEVFLNEYQKENLEVNGIYEQVDFDAVERFQSDYSKEILNPWKSGTPTGFVYVTTVRTINKIKCGDIVNKTICPYFTQYHKLDDTGGDVLKIQKFLNTVFGEKTVTVSGTYDMNTFNAVKRFQKEYSGSILVHWGIFKPTGWWYKTTRKQANLFMGCKESSVFLEGVNKIVK